MNCKPKTVEKKRRKRGCRKNISEKKIKTEREKMKRREIHEIQSKNRRKEPEKNDVRKYVRNETTNKTVNKKKRQMRHEIQSKNRRKEAEKDDPVCKKEETGREIPDTDKGAAVTGPHALMTGRETRPLDPPAVQH